MISNTVGHFGSCYRTPRADSAPCGANRSDLGKRRAGDGSSKGRRTFFLQRWARAWLGARPGRLGTVQCPGVQISDMSSLNDDGSTFEKKRQDEKRLVWCCEWYLQKSHLGRGKPGSAASYWVKRRIIFTPKQWGKGHRAGGRTWLGKEFGTLASVTSQDRDHSWVITRPSGSWT